MRKLTNHRTRCMGSTKRNNNKRIITITINEATITVNNEATAGSDVYVDWSLYKAAAPAVTAKPSPSPAPSADLVFADLSDIAAEFDAIEPEANTAKTRKANTATKQPQSDPKVTEAINRIAKPITDQERRDIDTWLINLFNMPTQIRSQIIRQTTLTRRLNLILWDAEARNWRATAFMLEYKDPEKWAPKGNISIDAGHPEKYYQKYRRPKYGTSK